MAASSRLPVVREARYPATTSPMRALAVTAKRGAARKAAGAVARIVARQVAAGLRQSQPPARKANSSVIKVDESPVVVEEVVYFRRRLYRRQG